MMSGRQPHAQPPTWRTRVSFFVSILPLDLSGLGGLNSSYATAGIALRVSGALKPPYHDKVRIASVGHDVPGTLKTAVKDSSDMLVLIYQSIRHQFPVRPNILNCENIKPVI
jgi:hypothetical protein